MFWVLLFLCLSVCLFGITLKVMNQSFLNFLACRVLAKSRSDNILGKIWIIILNFWKYALVEVLAIAHDAGDDVNTEIIANKLTYLVNFRNAKCNAIGTTEM